LVWCAHQKVGTPTPWTLGNITFLRGENIERTDDEVLNLKALTTFLNRHNIGLTLLAKSYSLEVSTIQLGDSDPPTLSFYVLAIIFDGFLERSKEG